MVIDLDPFPFIGQIKNRVGFLLFGRFTCHSRGTTWGTGAGVGGAGGEVMTLSVNLRSIKKKSVC
jgi:hypothetical protein